LLYLHVCPHSISFLSVSRRDGVCRRRRPCAAPSTRPRPTPPRTPPVSLETALFWHLARLPRARCPSARHVAERRRRSRRLCPRVARRRPPLPLNPVVAVEVAKFVFASSLSPSLRAEFLGPLLARPEAPPASMSAAALTSPRSATIRPPSAQPTTGTRSPPLSEAPEPRRHRPGPSAGRRRHCWPPKLRPAVDPRLPALLRPIEPRSELACALLSLPSLSPARFRHHRRRNAAAPPWLPAVPPAHAAGCLCADPGTPAARLGAAGLPWPPCCPAPPTPWPVAGKPGTPRRRPWPWWPWRGCVCVLLL
jgi:hypothetical protein